MELALQIADGRGAPLAAGERRVAFNVGDAPLCEDRRVVMCGYSKPLPIETKQTEPTRRVFPPSPAPHGSGASARAAPGRVRRSEVGIHNRSGRPV